MDDEKCVSGNLTDQSMETALSCSAQSAGSLATKWRKLADSWIAATKGMDVDDDCRIRAEARAEAFLDCADQLEAKVRVELPVTPEGSSDEP